MELLKLNQYTDEEVIAQVLAGNTALYEIIIRRYNPYLFKTGRGYGFDAFDTEDLMQETFVSAYLSLSKFENRATLKTWLVRIMLNHCFHKKKKRLRLREVPIETINEEAMSSNTPDTENSCLSRELGHVLEAALDKIPEIYRIVFSLRELSGLNTFEVAEALEISESNVKVRLNRAKSLLRTEIQQMYTPEDIFEFNLIYCDRIVDQVMLRIANL